MRALYLTPLFFACLIPACVVYDDSLIDEDGSVSTGGRSDGGSSGSSSGGTPSTGGVSATGGSNETGGSDSGGAGGENPGSGGGTGGSNSNVDVVDDLEQGGASYFNDNFNGAWRRAIQTTGGAFTAVTEDDMVQVDPDDPENHALHVVATDLDQGDSTQDWGVDVYVSLNGVDPSAARDVSEYTGLSFRARAGGPERGLKVKLEDAASSYEVCGPSCSVAHAASAAPTGLPAEGAGWKSYKVPLSSVIRATPAFDATNVYKIHFTLDPVDAVDFWLDDIAFYKD